ncbi:MAG: hypothetical protein WBL74_11840 [Novosphingobium sp.]|uniref:hypothetical protein n=1 Tax=Novosphingobium sp. TaxID=1874826 RepID=UPI003C797B09
MIAEFALLFALMAVVVVAPVIGQVRRLAPQIAKLRAELAAPPQMRELRFTIREVIAVPVAAQIVAFPARVAPAAGKPGHWRKAA